MSDETIIQLNDGYKKTLEKTKSRLDNVMLSMSQPIQYNIEEKYNYDLYDSFDFPEIDLEETNEVEKNRVCK